MDRHKIEVTKVDVYPFKSVAHVGRIRAIANIVLNDQIQVRGLRVMDGEMAFSSATPSTRSTRVRISETSYSR